MIAPEIVLVAFGRHRAHVEVACEGGATRARIVRVETRRGEPVVDWQAEADVVAAVCAEAMARAVDPAVSRPYPPRDNEVCR